ncbi:DNA-directed DNA polymerase II small subunit [Candidatus Woesearchaeota archaeon]|nr:DNA-directed DNA polymerase II small subunit [Candidatus Woesearchaeota archaeon]
MQQELKEKRKNIVTFFIKKGILVNKELLQKLDQKETFDEICKVIEEKNPKEITVLNEKIKEILQEQNPDTNWVELEKGKAISEKKNITEFSYGEQKTTQKQTNQKVEVVFSYKGEAKKRTPQDFVDYFNCRLKSQRAILKQRQELQNTISINRIFGKKDREQLTIIGMVRAKQETKNGNCMLTLEDETGHIRVIINKTKPDMFSMSKDIVLDEVVGISGVNGDNIVFANNMFFPDVPTTKELKKSEDEAYSIFLSDLHVGSIDFLEDDFNRFLKWINQETGNEEQKAIASKVKYIFVLGDLVDGCGIYPGQELELNIKDVKDQYAACAKLLSKIPEHINLVICTGNHDAMRVAEPQLPIYKDFAEPIYALSNATIVSNPSLVNIHSSENFSGFDVLIYHGYSFDYYIAEVESIRNSGGYDRADLVMKFLLQKRHLAPTHTSTLYVPDTQKDPLHINKVPDFFVSGHIHKSAATNYRNITLLSGSCWQKKTAFQEKVGHHPEPSRVPIINLKTRKIKILKFGKKDESTS